MNNLTSNTLTQGEAQAAAVGGGVGFMLTFAYLLRLNRYRGLENL